MTERAKAEGAGPVVVPREVFEGIEAIRASGATNMLARDVVADLAEDLGLDAAADWIRENRGIYARGVFLGFAGSEDRPAKM
jgi:hypothetical protein